VLGCDDDPFASRLQVQLDGGGEQVTYERSADAKPGDVAVDGESADEQRGIAAAVSPSPEVGMVRR